MKHKKGWFFIVILILAIIPLVIGIIQHNKKLPTNISLESPTFQTDHVKFLYDATYEQNNERVMEQQLFDTALEVIDQAEQFLVVDMFLFNDDYDRAKGNYPNVAEQITDAIIQKRQQNPDMSITVITDKMNTLYLSNKNPFLEELKANNIDVALTDMSALRDSNPLYSSIWRAYLQWWKPSENGFLPNAFNPDGGEASFGSYFDLLNFKANHRKVILNEQRALLTSANLTHDGSSSHSNIGFIVEGEILKEFYKSEQAVAKLSGVEMENRTFETNGNEGELAVKLITEGKIKEAILSALNETTEQDIVKIGVFYMSDRDIIKAIKSSAGRGTKIQMILDPNKDAFGIEKNGIPNRQVASELIKKDNIEVRWYATNGEQFHSKFLFIQKKESALVIGGSANFTKRNLADYNLESNLSVQMPVNHTLATEINSYFDRLWTNETGSYTVDFEVYEDQSLWKKAFYRLQEFTGLSTF